MRHRFYRTSFVTADDIAKFIRHFESEEVKYLASGDTHMAEVMEAGYSCLESGEPKGILCELIDPKWPLNNECLNYISDVGVEM